MEQSLQTYLPHVLTAVTTAMVVGVPSWLGIIFTLYKLKQERRKTVAETHKTDAETRQLEGDNYLRLWGEFQKLAQAFGQIKGQLEERDSHVANCERLIQRISVMFREFFNDLDIGFWEANAGGERLYFNKAWLDMTGMKFKEACGQGWQKCIHPEDLENLLERDAAMMFEGATLKPVNCRIVNQKTKEIICVSKMLFTIFNSDGTVYRFYGKVKLDPTKH